jgi:hypothetical protein
LVYISKDLLVPILDFLFDVFEFFFKFEHPYPLVWKFLLPPLVDFLLEGGMVDPELLKYKWFVLRCSLKIFFQLNWPMIRSPLWEDVAVQS